MPQPKNHFLRLFIPTTLAVVAVGLAFLVFRASTNKTPPAQPVDQSTSTPAVPNPDAAAQPAANPADPNAAATPKAPTDPAATPVKGSQPADSAPTTPPPPPTAPAAVGAWTVRYFPVAEAGEPGAIGSLDKDSTTRQRLTFADVGAGLAALELAGHFETIKDAQHISLQQTFSPTTIDGVNKLQVPFSAFQLGISEPGGAPLWLNVRAAPNADERVWRRVPNGQAGEFEAFIVDTAGAPVLRIVRSYTLAASSYDISINQRIENQSGRPLTIVWKQFGPTEMHQDARSYGGDKRKMRFGYLLDAKRDPTRAQVVSGNHELDHPKITGKLESWGAEHQVWPNDTSIQDAHTLSWTGLTSRYFGVAVHPLYDTALKTPDKSLAWVERISTIVPAGTLSETERSSVILTSKPLTIAPQASADISMGVFAGPMDRRLIRTEPLLDGLNLDEIVVYNFGGMCGFCTFGLFTKTLLGLLHILHDVVFRDWALAIIFLVVIVRTCLHPVTRWSQIRMQRFGKQMQAIGPKQKQLQEKYGKDQKKLQEETSKLWREEGISPAGMLGCLPMFLQTPVWIALYAVLYFAVELRHEHAFFGLFQSIQPQTSPFWWFLGDLAEPDRFWYFAGTPDKYIKIPLLSGLVGPVGAVNILPLILGVVFFIQQKYLTPPATTTMTPEQEMQQKMIKWMTVFMFPIFMYNAPSGLALYFIANSALGILESRWIRSHITQNDLLNPPKKPDGGNRGGGGNAGRPGGKPGGGGFLARMQALAEQKQREAVEKGRQAHKKR